MKNLAVSLLVDLAYLGGGIYLIGQGSNYYIAFGAALLLMWYKSTKD